MQGDVRGGGDRSSLSLTDTNLTTIYGPKYFCRSTQKPVKEGFPGGSTPGQGKALGTATLKQVRRAVSLHLQPPPWASTAWPLAQFPIMGVGKEGVEGSPEVPAFRGCPVTGYSPLTRSVDGTGMAWHQRTCRDWCGSAVRPRCPLEASFLGGRRRVSVWCSSFLNGCTRDWFVFRLTWGADGKLIHLDAQGPMRRRTVA